MFPEALLDNQTLSVIEEEKAPLLRQWRLYGERVERTKLSLLSSPLFQSQGYLCFSEFMRTILVERGLDADQIHPLRSGVPTDIFYPTDQTADTAEMPFELLFVGKPTKRKGLQVLFKAISTLSDEGFAVRVRILGSTAPPENITVPRSIREQITFAGRVERSALAEEYRRADAYVIPSYYELESTSMIEALACGTPCVATDDASFREIGTDASCLFFEKGNAISLAQAIESLYDDYASYRTGAVTKADKYDIKYTFDDLISVYRSVL